MRNKSQLYPDFTAECAAIDTEGFTPGILDKIISKHGPCRQCMLDLYDRYCVLDDAVPIFKRQPRFAEDRAAINNKINNDFFSEINDFKIGYFAGKPIAYSYNHSQDSEEDTGGKGELEKASKALSDFVALNNFPDVDMEITKFATVCGYAGRLFYHDELGRERIMVVPPFESALLGDDITAPKYAVRYYSRSDLSGNTYWHAECYGDGPIKVFEGQPGNWAPKDDIPNLYDSCPLQGIPNNGELLGDAEKVTSLIDAYDRALSDQSNEVEAFSNSYLCFENVKITDAEMEKAQATGEFQYYTGQGKGNIHYLTKDATGELNNKHLDRLEDNIYRFSKTPNLNDEAFGTASGIALKFRLTGLETKCGIFQAKMQSAATYMFQCISNAWSKKGITLDPLEVDLKFSRNFPLDLLSEAQSAQQMIAAGLPKRVAYSLAFPEIDDVDEVMEEIESEKDGIPPLEDDSSPDNGTVKDDGGTANEGRAAKPAGAGAEDSRTS